MLNFLLLMLVPVGIAVGTILLFRARVLWWEFLMQVGIVALVVGVGFGLAYVGRTHDVEVWNGQVSSKTSERVSCRHSYPCNCREVCSGSGQNETCTEVCDTCYEHAYDVEWDVMASTGEGLSIDTIDRQGLLMPPRWARAYVGEPWASEHSYTNYIKANPSSVLLGTRGDMAKWQRLIPTYPSSIYDYYYNDPVINMGVKNVDLKAWNWLVREQNKTLGPEKQVHLVVILVPTSDRSYMFALKDAWFGGKKNDVDVVIGSVDGNNIDWASVMSWSTNKNLAVVLRDDIEGIGYLTHKDEIVGAIGQVVRAKFQRMQMADMKWIMRGFQPSRGAMLGLFVLGVFLSLGLSIYNVLNDINVEDLNHDWGHVRWAANLKYPRKNQRSRRYENY